MIRGAMGSLALPTLTALDDGFTSIRQTRTTSPRPTLDTDPRRNLSPALIQTVLASSHPIPVPSVSASFCGVYECVRTCSHMLESGDRATWVHRVLVEAGVSGEMLASDLRPGRGRLSSVPERPICSGPPVHDYLCTTWLLAMRMRETFLFPWFPSIGSCWHYFPSGKYAGPGPAAGRASHRSVICFLA